MAVCISKVIIFKQYIVTGLPVRPSYKFGFQSSVYKNGLPGEGRHEGLVPRNDVLTNGFIRFSLTQTLARILFVPRLRPCQKPRRRCEPLNISLYLMQHTPLWRSKFWILRIKKTRTKIGTLRILPQVQRFTGTSHLGASQRLS